MPRRPVRLRSRRGTRAGSAIVCAACWVSNTEVNAEIAQCDSVYNIGRELRRRETQVDLTDLELVVHIADAGSITHGAARTHLTLPSASARIRALERATSATLFTRKRRGVTPTPAGLLLLRHARTIVHAIERMRLELAEHAEGHSASVRILANTAATASALTPAVTAFATTHPQVRIDLDEQPSHQIVASVMERRVELGIVADSVDLGGLKTRTVRADPLVVCTAATDPLAQRISIPCLHLRDTARPPPTHQGPLDQLLSFIPAGMPPPGEADQASVSCAWTAY